MSLHLEAVTMRFGGVVAVADLDLSVPQGKISALIGPNGAGKSTAFNCINGIYKPSTGKVFFEGKDITGLRPHAVAHRGIARTFQNLALFKNMTVLENLLLGRNQFLSAGVLRGGPVFWQSHVRRAG